MSGGVSVPTADQVKAWIRNHVCTPLGGIPQSFVEELTGAADGGEADEMKHLQ